MEQISGSTKNRVPGSIAALLDFTRSADVTMLTGITLAASICLGDRINGVFHLVINRIYWGFSKNPHDPTYFRPKKTSERGFERWFWSIRKIQDFLTSLGKAFQINPRQDTPPVHTHLFITDFWLITPNTKPQTILRRKKKTCS